MPFLTAAAIIVGEAAAKSIFKLWVKDPTIDTISSGLIDLIGSKTSDIFTQREGER